MAAKIVSHQNTDAASPSALPDLRHAEHAEEMGQGSVEGGAAFTSPLPPLVTRLLLYVALLNILLPLGCKLWARLRPQPHGDDAKRKRVARGQRAVGASSSARYSSIASAQDRDEDEEDHVFDVDGFVEEFALNEQSGRGRASGSRPQRGVARSTHADEDLD